YLKLIQGEHPIFKQENNMFMASYGFSMTKFPSEQPGNLHILAASYAKPMHFGTHGRMSVELGGILGQAYYTDGGTINQAFVGAMYEAVFNIADLFYAGVGAGPYIRNMSTRQNPSDPIGSEFVLGTKFSAGRAFKNWNVELFYRHFSNGGITTTNRGFDFFGIGVGYRI
ncbi:MAG: hypothetical protein RL208_365, partial [Pseudomonadota bacterium]